MGKRAALFYGFRLTYSLIAGFIVAWVVLLVSTLLIADSGAFATLVGFVLFVFVGLPLFAAVVYGALYKLIADAVSSGMSQLVADGDVSLGPAEGGEGASRGGSRTDEGLGTDGGARSSGDTRDSDSEWSD